MNMGSKTDGVHRFTLKGIVLVNIMIGKQTNAIPQLTSCNCTPFKSSKIPLMTSKNCQRQIEQCPLWH
jgi:hypothetical protein